MSDSIINKVATSPLLSLDLEEFYPKEQTALFDLKPLLFMELILKEKDFRVALQNHNWEQYKSKIVGVTCTADAIIPIWAYMLISTYLQPLAKSFAYGDEKTALEQQFLINIASIDESNFRDKRIVIKGCGDRHIGEFAYLEITKKLLPVAKSIMYGEPCSTVPVFKKK